MAKANDLKPQARGLLIGLTLQYLLGMTATLFVKFPDGVRGGQSWQFAWRQVPVALHIIIGISLIVGGIALIVRAVRAHDRSWIIASCIGFAAVLLAGIAGSVFIATMKDLYSLIMAVLFIVAFGAYGWGIYQAK